MRLKSNSLIHSLGLVFSAGLILLPAAGCSVYMAASQPEKKDLSALDSGGMPRDHVIAKLGAPTSSTMHEDGTRTDIYEFYEGSAGGWKVGRATFHAVADVFTLGLWEIVGTPTEMAVKGEKVTARAIYDKAMNLTEFKVLGQKNTAEAKQSGEVAQAHQDGGY